MRRQFLQTFLGLAGTAVLSGLAPKAHAQANYTVSPEQLQSVVAQRFPLRYPVVGLFDLTLRSPQLRLLPEQNRLGLTLAVMAAGEALRNRYAGSFDVDFALRYEASDRTIRAWRLRVNALRFPALRAEVAELINGLAPRIAQQTVAEVVLHQLKPEQLSFFDGLGMQPGNLTVAAEGLVIDFVPKPLAPAEPAPPR